MKINNQTSGELAIESGVEMPQKHAKVGLRKYPFRDLEVGDSFLVGVPEGKTPRAVQTAVAASWHRYSKTSGRKFSSRVMKEGVRCWRTK